MSSVKSSSVSLKKILLKGKILSLLRGLVLELTSPLVIQDREGEILVADLGMNLKSNEINNGNEDLDLNVNDIKKLPILIDGEVLGWVVGTERVEEVTDFLIYIVNRELERKMLATEALDKYREISLLYAIAGKLSSCLDVNAISQLVIEEASRLIRSTSASMMLYNPESNCLEIVAANGTDEQKRSLKFSSEEGIEGHVFVTGKPELVNDVTQDPRYIINENHCHALICVPIMTKERILGVGTISNSNDISYTSQDLKLFTAIVTQASSAIENARLHKNMQSEVILRTKLERFFPAAVSQKIEEGWDLNRIVETEVTALFSDITGFTAMTSQMQPRKILEFLNEYFKVMVEDIVFPLGGTLEKYIADALLAVWGAPYQKDDDAIMAVSAAIKMQWAMSKLNEAWAKQGRDLQIQIHIGLNTGMVASGNIGSEQLIQYCNIGDTMNVASRICTAASAGEIFISETTRTKISQFNLPLERLDLIKVKGKEEPLQLYRIEWESVDIEAMLNKKFFN